MKGPLARCPDCGGEAALIGPIPATDVCAGNTLEQPLRGGWLYRCRQCLLGFRWPRLGKRELDALYEQGSESAWTASASERRDWCIAQCWLEEKLRPGGSILDVGCFDGGFLEPLVGQYRCYGVEIHSGARKRAEDKGIRVLGSDFSAVEGEFDFITAFDVIEHVEYPKRFLNQCITAVRQGGWVLISTGNLDALSSRVMGSRYWYCTIAEHVSFVSPAWFSRLTSALGCRIENQSTFAHAHTSLSRRTREAASNLFYRMWPSVFRGLRRLGAGRTNVKEHPEIADRPPGWSGARDHFLVLLQKL
ncbi:MAG: class I SAM-dependent methyltransferase [Gallionella sp.]|nr:class I SAM-dependent methyltransferase [Gallionella sp.]